MVHLNNPLLINQWMKTNSELITAAVKRQLPASRFNAHTIPREQARRLHLLGRDDSAFHPAWDSLDVGRRSAACRYEWARIQMFVAAVVHHRLAASCNVTHLTLADRRWRVEPELASAKVFDRPRRKFRAGMQALRDAGFAPKFVASYELSGDRNLNGTYSFEPHAHVLIGNVPDVVLRDTFRVRLPRAARGGQKPLRITPVPDGQLGQLLGYVTKMLPQDRVEFVRSDGRNDRKSNRMPLAQEMQWLSCMAAVPITHLIQFGGFTETMTSTFINAELATIIEEL